MKTTSSLTFEELDRLQRELKSQEDPNWNTVPFTQEWADAITKSPALVAKLWFSEPVQVTSYQFTWRFRLWWLLTHEWPAKRRRRKAIARRIKDLQDAIVSKDTMRIHFAGQDLIEEITTL